MMINSKAMIKRTEVTTTVTIRHSAEVTGALIKEALGLPADAKVVFQVPGGANWANCSIEVDDDNPVLVEWEATSQDTVREDSSE